MKYIKTFEKIISFIPEDSVVIFIYADDDSVEQKKYVNDIFTLIEVDKKDTDYPYYIEGDDWFSWVGYDQIRLATPEEIEQYEIRKNTEKYNL